MFGSQCIRLSSTLIFGIFICRLIDSEATKYDRFRPSCCWPQKISSAVEIQREVSASFYLSSRRPFLPNDLKWLPSSLIVRGGEQDVEEMTLDQKVHAAMRKLGLTLPDDVERENIADAASNEKIYAKPPPPPKVVERSTNFEENSSCDDGVCQVPPSKFVPPPPLPPKIPHRQEMPINVNSNDQDEYTETSNQPILNEYPYVETTPGSEQPTNSAEPNVIAVNGVDKEGNSGVEGEGTELSEKFFAAISRLDANPRHETSHIDKIQEKPEALAARISKELNVDVMIVMAALVATSTVRDENNTRIYNEAAARSMIELELQMINQIPESCTEVEQLVSEGHSVFLSRRALAFAERNVEDARAILQADQLDDEEDQRKADATERKRMAKKLKDDAESSFKTVSVNADFDPTAIDATKAQIPIVPPTTSDSSKTPEPASKDTVVFEATTAQIRELVIDSPVPVLLDVYADWCGPCKALSPMLEEMAVKLGGAFRLVKLNSDNERELSSALEVTALPTIFGVKNGRILNMFQGMPKSEEMMRNFLMALIVPGQSFKPPVSDKNKQLYEAMSVKILKIASTASYPFSARERLAQRVTEKLHDMVREADGDVVTAEESAQTMRNLLNNAIKEPFNAKFRRINLANKIISAKIAKFPACITILKAAGFAKDKTKLNAMLLGSDKNSINIAPLIVTRDAIDKWIDTTRYEVSKEARKRKDELDRQKLETKPAQAKTVDDVEDEVIDPNLCTINIRFEGKRKSHEQFFHADDSLLVVLAKVQELSNIETSGDENDVFQFTCVAKKLVVVSSDIKMMSKTLRDLHLDPRASLVVARVQASTEKGSPKLSERVASKKKKKTGSHTMQSIGVYAKDDKLKGELIDGGGGTLFEHDVTDDEDEDTDNNPNTEDDSGSSGK